MDLLFTYLSFLVKIETVSVPSSFFFFGIFKVHLSREHSEQHRPLLSSLESDSDIYVAGLGLPTNTDQNPEFQEQTAPPSFTAELQEVLVFQPDPPPSPQPAWLYKSLETTPVAQHRLWKSGQVVWAKKNLLCVFKKEHLKITRVTICSKLIGNLCKFYSYKKMDERAEVSASFRGSASHFPI